jgi:hypothetical protein
VLKKSVAVVQATVYTDVTNVYDDVALEQTMQIIIMHDRSFHAVNSLELSPPIIQEIIQAVGGRNVQSVHFPCTHRRQELAGTGRWCH